MTSPPERGKETPPSTAMPTEALDEVLRFGAQLLRAGDTAFRVRQAMRALARGMGFDALSVQLGLGSITASGRRGSERATLVREVGAMQRLVSDALWDEVAMLETYHRLVQDEMGEPDGVRIVDETGFVKKGANSVGVARQYCGSLGKVDNGQVGVCAA